MTLFPLNEGPLAVNLANTTPSDRPGRDLLATADAVAAWARAQHGFVDAQLLGAVEDQAPDVLELLRAARKTVRAVLDATADGRVPFDADVRALNGFSASAPSHAALIRAGDRWQLIQTAHAPTAIRIAAAAATSAIEIVAGDAAVRRCARSGCDLLFVGGHPRRTWCDSRTCGNRVRAARHSRKTAGG